MTTIIETVAPIALEELKKYFVNKDIIFLIDYEKSSLTGAKLLTYLGNLDIPCDINLNFAIPAHFDLLKEYFETGNLLKISSLEKAAILCLLEKKELINTNSFKEFIKENNELLNEWESRLDSLTLFNMQTVEVDEFKNFVEQFPESLADASKYVNFVNLIRYEDFFLYYSKIDNSKLKNYKNLFNNYCYRGKNLYSFWAVETNPLFLLTWAIASGNLDTDEYVNSVRQDYEMVTKESKNVSPV
jgi:hypothetical protein